MDRVVAHFVGRDLRFEIERPEAAVAAAGGVEFWIEIKDAVRGGLDESQVGITGALNAVFGCARKIAAESWDAVELFTKQIFEVAAGFIDSAYLLNGTVWRVHGPDHFVQDRAHLFNNTLVGFAFRIDRQNALPRRIENHLAEWNG